MFATFLPHQGVPALLRMIDLLPEADWCIPSRQHLLQQLPCIAMSNGFLVAVERELHRSHIVNMRLGTTATCVMSCSAVGTFSTESEAVQLANDSEFGLAGAVISANQERCKRVAEALECGIVWVNCSQPCFCQVSCSNCKSSDWLCNCLWCNETA